MARLRVFIRAVALGVVIAAILTAFVCWLIGWRTWMQYGQALIGAGLLIAILGGLGFFSSSRLLGSPNYWYAQSVMPNSLFERWRMNLAPLDDDFDVTVVMLACGVLTMLCGLVVLAL